MEVFSFRTFDDTSEGNYKELGSKFLAFAYPVDSEDEVKIKIEGLRKKYFDARHHCFAWILGEDKSRYRAFKFFNLLSNYRLCARISKQL